MYAELTIDQGTTFESSIQLTNDDGTAMNVANSVFSSQIRKSYFSSNVTSDILVTIVDAPNGNIQLSITSANTANIKPGRYLYDLKMTNSSNVTIRIIEGIVTVTPQVSR